MNRIQEIETRQANCLDGSSIRSTPCSRSQEDLATQHIHRYICMYSNNVTYIRNSHTYIHTYVTHIRNTCMYIQVHLHKHIYTYMSHTSTHTCTYTRTFYNPTTSKLRYSLSIQSHQSSHFEDESKWCAFKAVKLHHPGTSGKKQPTPELYINNGAKEVCYFQ